MAVRRGLCTILTASRRPSMKIFKDALVYKNTLATSTFLEQRLIHTTSQRLNPADESAQKFEIINIQDGEHFQQHVLNSKVPVIVDFHATWCGPCKVLAPRLEKLINNHSMPVNLVKVDVDKLEDLAMKYRVQGVPAVFAIKDGKVTDKFVGVQEEDIIEAFITKLTK